MVCIRAVRRADTNITGHSPVRHNLKKKWTYSNFPEQCEVSSPVKTKIANYSEMLVSIYQIIRHHSNI